MLKSQIRSRRRKRNVINELEEEYKENITFDLHRGSCEKLKARIMAVLVKYHLETGESVLTCHAAYDLLNSSLIEFRKHHKDVSENILKLKLWDLIASVQKNARNIILTNPSKKALQNLFEGKDDVSIGELRDPREQYGDQLNKDEYGKIIGFLKLLADTLRGRDGNVTSADKMLFYDWLDKFPIDMLGITMNIMWKYLFGLETKKFSEIKFNESNTVMNKQYFEDLLGRKKCPFCLRMEKTFSNKQCFRQHFRYAHGIKIYKCDLCNKIPIFTCKKNRDAHRKRDHGNDDMPTKRNDTSVADEVTKSAKKSRMTMETGFEEENETKGKFNQELEEAINENDEVSFHKGRADHLENLLRETVAKNKKDEALLEALKKELEEKEPENIFQYDVLSDGSGGWTANIIRIRVLGINQGETNSVLKNDSDFYYVENDEALPVATYVEVDSNGCKNVIVKHN